MLFSKGYSVIFVADIDDTNDFIDEHNHE